MDDEMPQPASESEILPNPQNDRRQRRRFAPDEKLRIVLEADSCTERGELATLLRRERLLKLAVWIERSVRRVVLHLPRMFPGRGAWIRTAKRLGASSA